MAGKDAKKTSKNKQRGRPSKELVTLRCLAAMGGRVRLKDLVHELDSAIVARIPESTSRTHLKRLMQRGVSLFWRLRLAPVIEERLSDTFTGRLLKSVLGGRAKFVDQTYVYSINTMTPLDMMALIALTLHLASYLLTGALHRDPHLSMILIIINLSVLAITLIPRMITGNILKRRLGISRNIKLTIGTPDGKKVERKFRADTKVMEVIKWAAAELYGDKDVDVTEYILQHEGGKELDRYAKLWGFDELWIRSGNDRSKGPYLVLVRGRKK
jgi:hypothetical protein